MMRQFFAPLAGLLVVWLGAVQPAFAQSNAVAAASRAELPILESAPLQALVERAVQETLTRFAPQKLSSNQLAVTLLDLREPARLQRGSFRGEEQVYPASVIKLFYLAAAHAWMEQGKLADSPELRRGLRDMVVDSLNEATGFIVDSLTQTTSGPELSAPELEQWYAKRNAVNRYFAGLGYERINANRKPWCEGPYGREMQSVRLHEPNHRNWLTSDATARLLAAIATGRMVSPARCEQMLELLARDPSPGSGSPGDQAHAYTALGLPAGAKLWSKAGWTSTARHDAAYVQLPNGARFVLVVFTTDHAAERQIIPSLARLLVQAMSAGQ